MDQTLTPELTLYLQILFTVLFLVVARIVLAGLRKIAGAPSPLIAQLLFPVSLLITTLPTKLAAVRAALPLGEGFFRYFDAAFVVFVILLIVRLIDGLIRLRFEKTDRPFPLPRVLHGFVLVLIYIVVVLAVLRVYLGFNIGPLLAGSAILTAVIGLALQGVLGNFF